MAYSVDLRKRVVAGVLEQGLSIGEAATLFQIGSATVERYLKQWRERGDLKHRTSPGRPRLLDAAQEEQVKQQLAQANDLKLKVRCAQLQETSGALVSEATMCRTLKRLGISRKKDTLGE
jgi:transposase